MYSYNQWYHPFIIGFNSWMVIAPLLLLGVGVPAFLCYTLRDEEYMSKGYREPRKCVVRWIADKEWIYAYAAASGVIFLLMLLLESWDGIVQLFVNSLPPIALAWVLSVVVVVITVLLYIILVLSVGLVFECARYGYLIRKAEFILSLYRLDKEQRRDGSENEKGHRRK